MTRSFGTTSGCLELRGALVGQSELLTLVYRMAQENLLLLGEFEQFFSLPSRKSKSNRAQLF